MNDNQSAIYIATSTAFTLIGNTFGKAGTGAGTIGVNVASSSGIISHNVFSNLATGINLQATSTNVDARWNLYPGTSVKIANAGTANLVPGQIEGAPANDNASAGNVGEFINASVPVGSAVTLTSGVAAIVTTIQLTPGDWDVNGLIVLKPGGGTKTTQSIGSINSVGGIAGSYGTGQGDTRTDGVNGTQVAAGALGPSVVLGPTRFSVSANTTIYLMAYAAFSNGNNSAFGYIRARRAR